MRIHHKREGTWQPLELDAACHIAIDGEGQVEIVDDDPGNAASIVAFTENGRPRAALVSRPDSGVTLNGFRPLGVAVLEDRDVIAVRGERLHFAAYGPAQRIEFPPAERRTDCVRCKRPLRAGDAVARCQACGALHHEGRLAGSQEQRLCLSYDAACGACFRRAADLMWSPDDGEGDD